MRTPKPLLIALLVVVAGLAVVGAWLTRARWRTWFASSKGSVVQELDASPGELPKVLKLSVQARKNLGIVAAAARPETYWRTVQIPGEVADRPGRSDRGVTSPAVGVVTEIHAFPGDTVHPGDRLFTLRLFSEYLQSTQKELFRATKETQLIQQQIDRLSPVAGTGGIPRSRIIDLENQRKREQALIQAHRQDLLTRGLSPQQVDEVAGGTFVATVDLVAPTLGTERPAAAAGEDGTRGAGPLGDHSGLVYEVQELNAELGQQVQAGQLLATLADHGELYLQGHAFKREAPFLETAAQQGWAIRVEFAEDSPHRWPALRQRFEIRHLSNAIDPRSRTFDFFIPLSNQSHTYEKGGATFVVWRFRPGQRVRLHVPVEQLSDVIVLPIAAVAREGPEAFVFQQNGNLFQRLPVQVVHEDRLHVVIANDGSVTPGLYLAQNAAASLNRALKAQAASGMRADIHVHADGTVHAAH